VTVSTSLASSVTWGTSALLAVTWQVVDDEGVELDPLAGVEQREGLADDVVALLELQARAELGLDAHVAGRAVAGVLDGDLELDRPALEHLARRDDLLDLELGLLDHRLGAAAGRQGDGRGVVEGAGAGGPDADDEDLLGAGRQRPERPGEDLPRGLGLGLAGEELEPLGERVADDDVEGVGRPVVPDDDLDGGLLVEVEHRRGDHVDRQANGLLAQRELVGGQDERRPVGRRGLDRRDGAGPGGLGPVHLVVPRRGSIADVQRRQPVQER
jgi:hypothetical protein